MNYRNTNFYYICTSFSTKYFIPWHKFLNIIFVEICHLRVEPVIYTAMQFGFSIKALCSESYLYCLEKVVVARRQILTVWWMIKYFPSKTPYELSSTVGHVWSCIFIKTQNFCAVYPDTCFVSPTLILSGSDNTSLCD